MLEYEAVRLYHDACKRYNVKPTYEGHKEWRDCLANIEYEEGLAALNEYNNENHKGVPFAQTIWKKAMTAKKDRLTMTKTNSKPSGDPFPDKDKDNRHFLEWMAAEEGKTPEEMEEHINAFMNEWEKNR